MRRRMRTAFICAASSGDTAICSGGACTATVGKVTSSLSSLGVHAAWGGVGGAQGQRFCCAPGRAAGCTRAQARARARRPRPQPRLHGPAAREEVHARHVRRAQLRERVGRDVRGRELADRPQQQPRAVERDVADAAHRGGAHAREVDRQARAVGVAVVPPHKLARGEDAGRVLPWNAQPPVALGAVRQHHLPPRRAARRGQGPRAAAGGRRGRRGGAPRARPRTPRRGKACRGGRAPRTTSYSTRSSGSDSPPPPPTGTLPKKPTRGPRHVAVNWLTTFCGARGGRGGGRGGGGGGAFRAGSPGRAAAAAQRASRPAGRPRTLVSAWSGATPERTRPKGVGSRSWRRAGGGGRLERGPARAPAAKERSPRAGRAPLAASPPPPPPPQRPRGAHQHVDLHAVAVGLDQLRARGGVEGRRWSARWRARAWCRCAAAPAPAAPRARRLAPPFPPCTVRPGRCPPPPPAGGRCRPLRPRRRGRPSVAASRSVARPPSARLTAVYRSLFAMGMGPEGQARHAPGTHRAKPSAAVFSPARPLAAPPAHPHLESRNFRVRINRQAAASAARSPLRQALLTSGPSERTERLIWAACRTWTPAAWAWRVRRHTARGRPAPRSRCAGPGRRTGVPARAGPAAWHGRPLVRARLGAAAAARRAAAARTARWARAGGDRLP